MIENLTRSTNCVLTLAKLVISFLIKSVNLVSQQRRHLEGSTIRIAEDLPFHIREIRKNFLVPALKKAKQATNVKASIVGDKLVVNGHRYTFNNIPMQWRNTQSQSQYVQAQETEDPDEHNTTEMESPQEMPEITKNVFL